MEHILYLDGNFSNISWIIQTNETIVSQSRKHTENHKNRITKIQSKYVALHVALFWGIGTFIIKNEDTVKIELDEKIMYEQLKLETVTKDEFITNKIKFIQNNKSIFLFELC